MRNPASSSAPSSRHDRCGECSLSTRRTFLGHVSGAVLLAFAGAEFTTANATTVTGTQTGPSTHAYPIPAADGVSIDKDLQVILTRWQGKVFAFPLACPHENTALRWRQADARFQCPRHESKYQPDGTFTSGRATRNMDRFAVTRNGSNVVVNLEKWFQSDKQPGEWAAAAISI